ncbi:MAG TPA: FAD-binding protein [Myxococcaceae bacterium]|jgi:xylitol oxidase
MIDHQKNWAGNYSFNATRLHRPTTIEQVQEIVSRARQIKVFGTRHSFNGVADSTEDHISLEHLNKVIAFDRKRHTVTVEGGIRYSQLCPQLHREGYALHNMASLPDVSVAGACATATHGSGDLNGNLATAVAALEIVKADGTVVELSRERDGETFQGAVVGLGGLGVVTKLTLDLMPAFEMRQDFYGNLPLAQLEAQFDTIMSRAYSVSLFTDWRSAHFNKVWLKRRITEGPTAELEPIWCEATLLTEQRDAPGPWYERLPHYQIDYLPSRELQTEYMVPRQYAVEALRVVNGLREQIAPLLLGCEVRTVAADTLWMSPYYKQDCIALHFSWKIDWPSVSKLLPRIEEGLAPFKARPHWGKLFAMPAKHVQSLYERLPDFQRLLREYDPQAKFRNAFLDTYIFDGASLGIAA